MYQMDARVRYSEVNEENRIRLDAVLDYFQDCCTFHSEDVGGGVSYLSARNQAWLLASWQIVFLAYPKLGERLRISTIPYQFKGVFGLRNVLMENEAGDVLAYANSHWIFVDTVSGRPIRIPQDIIAQYPLDDPYPMEYAPRKVRMPDQMEPRREIPVQPFFIDTNHHVNNGKYVLLGEEFLPKDFLVRELRVEYRKAAVLGDIFHPYVKEEDGKVSVALSDGEGNPYVAMEFLRGENDAIR